MRILHIDTGLELRGGQRQVLLLLDALRRAGHESVLLAHGKGALYEAARAAVFPVYRAGILEIWRRSGRADLVHAHDARAHTLAVLSSRCKIVVSRRVAFPIGRSFASRWKYGRATRFLAVSHFIADELHTAGIAKDRIDVVYDGVGQTPSVQPWSAEYPAVAIASRDPQKGRNLIELAARHSQIPVIFSSNLEADLQRASMFVYITRSEGLGSAVLLAMSMGVPVIASRVGGLPEICTDGVSSILVANEIEQIARAMLTIRQQPEMACRLIAQGRELVAQRFTKQHLLERTIASYRLALSL